MGLLATAYTNIRELQGVVPGDGDPRDATTGAFVEKCFIAYVNPSFQAQAGNLRHLTVYGYDEMEHFWNYGYTSYHHWRDLLVDMVSGAWYEKPAFQELINFSDCEGIICSEVAAKLLDDFDNWDFVASQHVDPNFYALYCQWRDCFKMATHHGAVEFH